MSLSFKVALRNVITGRAVPLFLIVFSLMTVSLAFEVCAGPQAGPQKVKELKALIEESKRKGIDTSKAEELDRRSFQAARSGDMATAAKLMDEAFAALRGTQPSGDAVSGRGEDAPQFGGRPEPGRGIPPGAERQRGRRPEGDRPGGMTPPQAGRGGELTRGEEGQRGRNGEGGPGGRGPVSAADFPEPSTGAMPVFVMAFTHHYEGPGGYYPSAAEVRKVADFFHKYEIPGTLFFDGILVDRLKGEDSKIFDLVNSYKLPLGYHGEETHGPYPVASDLCAEVYHLNEAQGYKGQWSITTGKKWDDAVREVTERYSHSRPYTIDEKTRMLDRRNPSKTDTSKTGGLKLVQEAFGRDVEMMTSHGLESAPEGYAFRKMSSFGFDQPAVPVALHALKIFKVDEAADTIMGIAGRNVSLFWYMGRIMCKGDDMGEASWHPPYINKLNRIDRSEPRLLVMGFSKLDENAAKATVDYLNDRFFPKNPGSKWVRGSSLAEEFEGEKEYRPSAADVEAISAYILKNWKDRPPDMVETPGRVFSLADSFDALAAALAGYGASGRLAESSELHQLYGPKTERGAAHLRSGMSVKIDDIASAAAGFRGASDGDRFIPATIKVSGTELNCAEFLYAMASAVGAISAGSKEPVRVGPSGSYPPYAGSLDTLFKPRANEPLCYTKGQLWTVKPVRLKGQQGKAGAEGPGRGGEAARTQGRPGRPGGEDGHDTASRNAGRDRREASVSAGSEKIDLVFASNLESSGGCYREDPTGADLYRVTIDLASQKASGLKRLTREPGKAEWFPSLSPDGRFAAYNMTDRSKRGPRGNEVRVVDLGSLSDAKLFDASRFPCFTSDGKGLFYSMEAPESRGIAFANFSASPSPSCGRPMTIVSAGREEVAEDPSPFPDGSRVAIHYRPSGGGASLAIAGTGEKGVRVISPKAGFGHAAVRPDGKGVVASISGSGRLAIFDPSGDERSRPVDVELSNDASAFARYDARFSSCAKVNHTYTDWLSNDLLVVSSQGADSNNKFSMSRLFVLRFAEGSAAPSIIDISSMIEAAAGKSGRDLCTASGRVLSN